MYAYWTRRQSSYFATLLVIVLAIFIFSILVYLVVIDFGLIEGPAGPPGKDGRDGTNSHSTGTHLYVTREMFLDD